MNGIARLLAADSASLVKTKTESLEDTKRHFPIPGHPDKAGGMRSKSFVLWLVYVSSFPLLVVISCDREGTGKPTYPS